MSDNRKQSIHHYSVKPLAVALRPSRQLGVILWGAGLAALLIAAGLPLPPWPRVLLVLLIAAATMHAMWRDVLLRSPRSIDALEVNAQGDLQCHVKNAGWIPAHVLGSSFVTPALVVLNLRLEGTRFARHVVMLPDAADADLWRQLRVWLRWGLRYDQP